MYFVIIFLAFWHPCKKTVKKYVLSEKKLGGRAASERKIEIELKKIKKF